jgi:hypothetical protein
MLKLVPILLLLVACGPSPQSQWKARGIANYDFTVQRVCFCPPDFTHWVRVEVRAGRAVSVLHADTGFSVNAQLFEFFNTIDKLFIIIEQAQLKPADGLDVSFDPTYGFPTRMVIDYIKQAADDEVTYRVRDFVVR